MYKERLHRLDIIQDRVNSTLLTDRIICHLPEIQADKRGPNVFLAFNADIVSILSSDYFDDLDKEIITMTKVANL